MRSSILAVLIIAISMPLHAYEIRDDLFPSSAVYEEDFTDTDQATKDLEISLVTVSPGKRVYENFGHTGIEVSSTFYDYGVFNFSPSFYSEFALGLLYYSVVRSPAFLRYDFFEEEGREVRKIKLNLSPEAENGIDRFLRKNTRPENSTYMYDYYTDNCATRVRDIYDAATGGSFRTWAESVDTGMTYREWADIYLSSSPFFLFFLNYLEGPKIDKVTNLWEASFLPDVLEKAISDYEKNPSDNIRKGTYPTLLKALFLSAAMFIIVTLSHSKKKIISAPMNALSGFIYLFWGIASVILIFMIFFTNHDVTYKNINPAILSPLLIPLSFGKFRSIKKRTDTSVLSGSSIALLLTALIFQVLTPFRQQNLSFYLISLSMYIPEFRLSIKEN